MALAAIVVVGIWYQFLRHDAPPPVTIEAAVAAMHQSAGATPQSDTQTFEVDAESQTQAHADHTQPHKSVQMSPAEAPPRVDGLNGEWVIQDATESFVGYRITEQLASIEAAEVVGRTTELEGAATIERQRLISASVTADMTRLESDQEERDKALKTQALETDTFPAATFQLTEPVTLPESLAEGETVTVSARGNLTVHGVTQPVEILLDAQVTNDVLVVVGSFQVTLADYRIDQSTAAFIASIEEQAHVEFQLFFAPA
jgi:polyisoprenoid-binding protein YceI